MGEDVGHLQLVLGQAVPQRAARGVAHQDAPVGDRRHHLRGRAAARVGRRAPAETGSRQCWQPGRVLALAVGHRCVQLTPGAWLPGAQAQPGDATHRRHEAARVLRRRIAGRVAGGRARGLTCASSTVQATWLMEGSGGARRRRRALAASASCTGGHAATHATAQGAPPPPPGRPACAPACRHTCARGMV
jgi:hypothetical protein